MTARQALSSVGRAHGSTSPADSNLVVRTTSVLRVLLVPILFIGDHAVAHPGGGSPYFNVILGVAAVYSLLMLAAAWWPGRADLPLGMTMVVDLVLISMLAFCTGRNFPQVRAAFLIAPVVAGIRLSPRRTAAMSVFAGVAYVVVALTHPTRVALPSGAVFAYSTFIIWTGALAVAISVLRTQRQRRIHELSEARGRLVAQVIESEERARKQISGALHDYAIQDLLTARQDLEEAQAGRAEALHRVQSTLDSALRHLRGVIEDLDPYVLDQLDLPAAIRAVAEREGRRRRHRVEINIDPAACGVADALIASLARELFSNAARHAHASVIEFALRRRGGEILLQVADDGRGFTHAQAISAVSAGHIGLAASQERVEAVGGSFTIESAPGGGTRIQCTIPLQTPGSDAASNTELRRFDGGCRRSTGVSRWLTAAEAAGPG